MATIAVFVALGGTSYAVATGSIDSRELKNNGIRGKDIRNNDVRTRDLRNNDVRTQDVRNGSLLARDFKAGQLPAGPRGPAGQDGTQGRDAGSMLTGSTQSGAIPTQMGGSGALTLPPSGVATFGGSGVQLSPNATVVARDLSVKLQNAPPPNSALRFEFWVNDVVSTLACTVEAGTTSCQDSAHAVTVPPGSDITLFVYNPGTANTVATGARWGWRATSP
jgi:hypothetical protein